MFIKLTQVYNTTANKTGGDLFIDSNSIHHMQTGLLFNGLSVTAIATTRSDLYVTETPAQIISLIEGEEEDI